ncbi:GNAT family N-acetyltransferase [Bradyrhizobium sp. Arg314]
MTEDALHVGLVEEVDCEEIRRISLLPARARPAPAYSYATEQFHLAAFLGDTIVSVATYLREDQSISKQFEDKGSSWRLRAMATHPGFRNQGLASAVLEHGLRMLRGRDATLLWANGRSTAMGFYLRHGFLQVGGERKPPGVQPHYRIERRI